MKRRDITNLANGRREFLTKISSIAALGLIGKAGLIGASASDHGSFRGQQASGMPAVKLGPQWISRLICGSNPFLGYSYMGQHTDRQMKEYYTAERAVEILRKCEQAGITTHQGSSRHDYISLLRERGSEMQIIMF